MKPFCSLLFLFFVVCTVAFAQPDLKHSFFISKKFCHPKDTLTTSGRLYRRAFTTKSNEMFGVGQVSRAGRAIDAIFIKFNQQMDTVWTKYFGGTDNDELQFIRELPNGNLLLAGTTSSNDGDVWYGHTYSAQEIWMVEVTTQGQIVKGKTFGGGNGSMIQDLDIGPDGMIYMAGMTNAADYDFTHPSFGFLNADVWFAKYDTAFNKQWIRVLSGNDEENIAQLKWLNPNKLAMSYLTLSTNSEMLGSQALGEIDNMIHIVDSNGVDLVKKRFGTSRWDNQIKLQCDTANQLVYLCGFVDTAENELVYMTSMNYLPQNRMDNMYVYKIDSSGHIHYGKAYGPINLGWTQDDCTLWDALFFKNHMYIIGETRSSGGDVEQNISPGVSNTWIGKVDSNCNLVASYTVNGKGQDYPWSLFVNDHKIGCIVNSTDSNNNLKCGKDNYILMMMTLDESPLQITQTDKDQIGANIYPNPAKNVIQIELADKWALGSTKIQVYEVNGNRIYKGTIKGNNYRINTEAWPPGMYYVEMMKGSQKVIQKVMKL
jgi:hypothetical protein